MNIKHHPTDQTLMDYASGSLSQAMELLVATHMTVCPHCRDKVVEFETMGGAVLENADSMAMGDQSLDHVMAMLERETSNENIVTEKLPSLRRVAVGESISGSTMTSLPRPLADLLPEHVNSLDDIPWKTLAPGVKHFQLKAIESKGTVRLLKIAPGISIPDHGHHGHEMTLLIKGSYIDEIGRFRAGDVADLDDDVDHQPIADTAEECICLIATDAPMKFNGLLPKLLQPFFGI
ncbi:MULTISPECIES: ChrR family anti-sigma-E factor [Thalassospira]|uniref:Anti-ECF sigma factor n=2 Tax=Thalassospira TaxID=168934 RepID=A0A367W7I0_9PROT|nr:MULTISPECIES: ChrR family anti-sigma-E factor [Thalassospira]MDG4720658.1 ChrR family anti-sigma-E factor [Thalassospira sp. FZY0004]RCK37373.1 anti-ECF sigma factor [Thalassospira profundimaris]